MPDVELCVVLWWLTVSLNYLISLFVPHCTDLHIFFYANGILQVSSLTFLNKTETKSSTIVHCFSLHQLHLTAWMISNSLWCVQNNTVTSVTLCKLLVFRCALTRSFGHVLIKRYWRSHRSPARCRQFLCQFSWRCEFGSRYICPQALQKEKYREITHPVIQVGVSTSYTSLNRFINWCLSFLRTQQLTLWNTINI